ncbi:2-oxoacid:ferredoxin oxidoreductase subunit beta [bacterium]|nr:2-oxoacid:ferredoxin oxidoreductase subunit beta [bacterium]
MNKEKPRHPVEQFLRMDRMPHIWCPGCGIGTVVTSFTEALRKGEMDLDKVCVVSGIGCTGRVAGYIKLDSFHTTHGRAVPFATGLKLGNPELNVVVFSGDGDIVGIGGNHFIHAARRNMDLTIIVVNNFNYAMTGGQVAATTPIEANASTSPYGNFEYPFSIPYLAEASGATYVARWTALHIRRITKSIQEAMAKPGFSVVEVITPCVTLYGRRNRLGDGLNILKYYYDQSEIQHNADPRNINISYQGKLIVGKFVDKEKPTFLDAMNQHLNKVLGDDYQKYGKIREDQQ